MPRALLDILALKHNCSMSLSHRHDAPLLHHHLKHVLEHSLIVSVGIPELRYVSKHSKQLLPIYHGDEPKTAVTRDSAISVTSLARMISHTIRPACPSLIHHFAMSVAFTDASNH